MTTTAQFLPTVHGFAFTNSWPSQPAVILPTPFGEIGLGNAAGGLCGGMVFAALDYWHAATIPPTAQPGQNDRLYGYIVRRLIESWHLPTGVVQYYQWMNLPDGDTGFDVLGRHIVIDRGLAWRTLRVQWPQIRSDLDGGTPVPLGVVTVASRNPADLGLNHQVLAYDYTQSATQITVRVYDPNQGRSDDTTIRFDPRSPTKPTRFDHNLDIAHPIRGFFRTSYEPSTPPGN